MLQNVTNKIGTYLYYIYIFTKNNIYICNRICVFIHSYVSNSVYLFLSFLMYIYVLFFLLHCYTFKNNSCNFYYINILIEEKKCNIL